MDGMQSERDAKILSAFGQRVLEIRKEKGFTQETLALAAGLDRTYIGSVERGERNVSLLKFYKIAEALNASAGELLKSRNEIH